MRERHSTIREGIIVGAIGATAVAVWFLLVDLVAGRPLFTPSAMGAALFGDFGGGININLGYVAGYTVFHYLAFIAVGMLAAFSTHLAEAQAAWLALFLVLFVAFEVGFYGLVATLNETGLLEALTWYQIGIGNLIATVAMAAYLWQKHPAIAGNLDRALSNREL